jgi:hypothetical protein
LWDVAKMVRILGDTIRANAVTIPDEIVETVSALNKEVIDSLG